MGAAVLSLLLSVTVVVTDADALRDAANEAQPGTRIELAPGDYAGGIRVVALRGTAERPVVIAAQDRSAAPVIRGGTAGLHLVDAEHVIVEDLHFTGQTGNAVNVDDGGSYDTPAHHVVLRRLTVQDVGPDGNRDGIKLSGVDDFRVEDCRIERWGSGGSAIDMVGCHRGVIERCELVHTKGTQRASGVQAKGGSASITIRGCRFVNAGARGVNAGGSTGLRFFRPPLAADSKDLFEARDVVVEDSVFIGGGAAVAFVGVDGATVRRNTIYRPGRWAVRILQETRDERFVPCRGGRFEENLVVFRSDAWRGGGVNVGDGTEAASFKFARNAWFCEDRPTETRALVSPPVEPEDSVFGRDPRLRHPEEGDLRPQASWAKRYGAPAPSD